VRPYEDRARGPLNGLVRFVEGLVIANRQSPTDLEQCADHSSSSQASLSLG
jgi:hypothetical protein